MGTVVGDGVGENVARSRNGLEAARTPAAVHVQSLDRRLADDWRAVAGHVDDAAPHAQASQARDDREGFDQGCHRVFECRKRAALRIIVIGVGSTTDHQFALVGLADVAMHRVGHDHAVDDWLDRLRYKRLQALALNGHAHSRHVHDGGDVARRDHPDLPCTDGATRGFEAGHLSTVAVDAGDFTVLNDVDAQRVRTARITPGHRIVTGRAAARLVIGAEDRVAAVGIVVDDRHDLFYFFRRDHAAVEAGQPVGVGGALEGAELVLRLTQHDNAARTEHHIVVQLLRQILIERTRQLINGDGGILQVVGADDGGIAPSVAATQPALLDHGDFGHFVVLGQIIGGGEAMAASTDDHRVIFGLGIGRTPGAFPVLVVVHRVAGE